MMSSENKTKTIIRSVLEDTGYAYTLADSCNADYAEFASRNALPSFQTALKDPGLSYEKLCKMLRRAAKREAKRQCKTPWSLFMANYLEKHCNSNQSGRDDKEIIVN